MSGWTDREDVLEGRPVEVGPLSPCSTYVSSSTIPASSGAKSAAVLVGNMSTSVLSKFGSQAQVAIARRHRREVQLERAEVALPAR